MCQNKIKICLIQIVIAIFFITSCSDECNAPKNEELIDSFNAHLQIVKTVTNTIDDGLEHIFISEKYSSINKVQLIQDYLEKIRFFSDNSGYLYCYDTTMTNIAHPILKSYIGTNHLNDKDANGKYFAHEMRDSLRKTGQGVISHYWLNLSSGTNEEKIAYVRLISNTEYFIGTGFFKSFLSGWSISKLGLEKEITRNAVQTTALGLSYLFQTNNFTKDEQIEFMKTYMDSLRFYNDNSGYFFVDDTNHFSIVFPTSKQYEGTSLVDYKDTKGNYPVRQMVEIIKKNSSGNTEYYYINPKNGIEQKKLVFVEKISGTEFFIGAGVYVE